MCPKSVAATIAGTYLGNINQNKPPPTLPKGWQGGKVENVFLFKEAKIQDSAQDKTAKYIKAGGPFADR